MKSSQRGWPCQVFPQGWQERGKKLLGFIQEAKRLAKLCQRPHRIKDGFAQLNTALETCLHNPEDLSGRQVGRIRLILARSLHKRGRPDSERCRQWRKQQKIELIAPLYKDLAKVLAHRLSKYPPHQGIHDLEPLFEPVQIKEKEIYGLSQSCSMPIALQNILWRSWAAPIDALIERGLVSSSEILAQILPQITANLAASPFSDARLRLLYGALYQAFRRRRSLLLLNLERQVQLDELPWVKVLKPFKQKNPSQQKLSKESLRTLVSLALRYFPQTLMPNKLLQEIRTLLHTAGMELPLVDELAADIFMGAFSNKYLLAAQSAGELLAGTLYARYYNINYSKLPAPSKFSRKQKQRQAHKTDASFFRLCESRAGVKYSSWDPSISGCIIEQEQILTSHNLAPLILKLNLQESLAPEFIPMAQKCWTSICRRLKNKSSDWHVQLIIRKNNAYSWRQMLVYLSLVSRPQQEDFVNWARALLAGQNRELHEEWYAHLAELEALILDPQRMGTTPFLGWQKPDS